MFSFRVIAALLYVIPVGLAREQFITFWTGTNFTGDALTFRSRHPNTPYYQDFIRHAQSFRCIGYWRLFTGPYYTGNLLPMCNYNEFSNINNPTPSAYTGSIRFAGNLDMSGWGIWLFSDTSLLGEERIITTGSANDFTFTPKSLLTTGFSSWTLFTGKNFDGASTCFVSTFEFVHLTTLNATLSNIQSVIRGCAGRTDTYIYGDQLS